MADATEQTKTKKPRKPQEPKPFYLVYSLNDDGDIEVHAFSRKTDEILTALDSNAGAKTKKLEAPKGR